jgi:hypothetical protein
VTGSRDIQTGEPLQANPCLLPVLPRRKHLPHHWLLPAGARRGAPAQCPKSPQPQKARQEHCRQDAMLSQTSICPVLAACTRAVRCVPSSGRPQACHTSSSNFAFKQGTPLRKPLQPWGPLATHPSRAGACFEASCSTCASYSLMCYRPAAKHTIAEHIMSSNTWTKHNCTACSTVHALQPVQSTHVGSTVHALLQGPLALLWQILD